MHTWWLILGLGGAGASLGILLVQVLIWRRLRGVDPVGAVTQGTALIWVGLPLAALHTAFFLMMAALDRPGWWIGGLATVASMPLRRLLNLKAFSVIVRRVDYENGPVRDRDGVLVAQEPYHRLVANWFRQEYTGFNVSEVLTLKVIGLLVHLLLWPIAALGAQASHVLMCQDPCDALGHETDGEARPGDALRDLGTPRLHTPARLTG